MVKRILRRSTFHFMLFSLVLIYMQINGWDSKSIMLIEFNVILKSIVDLDGVMAVINSGPMIETRTILGETSLYIYILHFVTFIIYGLTIDILRKIGNSNG